MRSLITEITASHSGVAVTCLTAVSEYQDLNPNVGSCRFLVKTTTTQMTETDGDNSFMVWPSLGARTAEGKGNFGT